MISNWARLHSWGCNPPPTEVQISKTDSKKLWTPAPHWQPACQVQLATLHVLHGTYFLHFEPLQSTLCVICHLGRFVNPTQLHICLRLQSNQCCTAYICCTSQSCFAHTLHYPMLHIRCTLREAIIKKKFCFYGHFPYPH